MCSPHPARHAHTSATRGLLVRLDTRGSCSRRARKEQPKLMKPGTFDGLTKFLAGPTSRRSAFRRLGGLLGLGTLGGVALADLSPGIALASGTNYDCLYFCEAVFPAGANRNQCLSDAFNGTGLCYSLG